MILVSVNRNTVQAEILTAAEHKGKRDQFWRSMFKAHALDDSSGYIEILCAVFNPFVDIMAALVPINEHQRALIVTGRLLHQQKSTEMHTDNSCSVLAIFPFSDAFCISGIAIRLPKVPSALR